MKKFKPLITSLMLVLVLTLMSTQCIKVFAEDDDPQGKSKSNPTTEAPPAPPPIVEILTAVARTIFSI